MVDSSAVMQFQRGLLDWAEEHLRSFPWREEDAEFYEVFMSEMFLRRTRSDVVESFIPEFFEAYPTLEALRDADQDELASVIRPMGLQNKRAQGLLNLAEQIEGDDIPREQEALLELPQVGPYVANATLCFALDEQVPIVDWNVDRVYRRLFGEEWTSLNDTEQYEFAAELLPDGEARTYNLGLLDFASLVCVAQEPDCERCFANDFCPYYAESANQQG